RIANAEWNVPLHLALQIKVAKRPRRAQEALDCLIRLHDKQSGLERRATLYFIVQTTEYLQPSEIYMERIARLITANASDEDVTWRTHFFSMLRSPNEMRPAIVAGLAAGVSECIRQNQLHKVAFVIDLLRASLLSGHTGLRKVPPKGAGLVQADALILSGGLRGILREKSLVQAAATKARLDLYGEDSAEEMENFGLRIWQASSGIPLNCAGWGLVDFALMFHELHLEVVEARPVDELVFAGLAHLLGTRFLEQAGTDVFGQRLVVTGFDLKKISALCERDDLTTES